MDLSRGENGSVACFFRLIRALLIYFGVISVFNTRANNPDLFRGQNSAQGISRIWGILIQGEIQALSGFLVGQGICFWA